MKKPCPKCGRKGLMTVLDVPYCPTCTWAGNVVVS